MIIMINTRKDLCHVSFLFSCVRIGFLFIFFETRSYSVALAVL